MSENPISALSVVVPVFNEAELLPRLMETLTSVLGTLPYPYEIILVNDGSTDNSLAVMRAFGATHARGEGGRFPQELRTDRGHDGGDRSCRRRHPRHRSMPTCRTIPPTFRALLAKLDEGYDVVSGWRKDRKDAQIRRKLVSRIANRLISRVSGVQLHDYGCTLKAYRRESSAAFASTARCIGSSRSTHSGMGARVTEIPRDASSARIRHVEVRP